MAMKVTSTIKTPIYIKLDSVHDQGWDNDRGAVRIELPASEPCNLDHLREQLVIRFGVFEADNLVTKVDELLRKESVMLALRNRIL